MRQHTSPGSAAPGRFDAFEHRDTPRVLLAGASVRAIAHSAIRDGFAVLAADRFTDWDLTEACETVPVAADAYAAGLLRIAREGRPGPWAYAGPLENHPDLVERISRHRMLWGNPAAVLRRVRDPVALSEAFAGEGLACAATRLSAAGLPRDGTWLMKPLRSAGGAGVCEWTERCSQLAHGERYYFQQRIAGQPCAAVYVASASQARLIGVTEQLVGQFHAKSFAYSGSLGPLTLSAACLAHFHRLGDCLVQQFGLCGIFGIDCILQGDVPYPVEVNPRWTASVELLEYVLGCNLMRVHAQAFQPSEGEAHPPSDSVQRYHGEPPRLCGGLLRTGRVAGSERSDGPVAETGPSLRSDPATQGLVLLAKAILYADVDRIAPAPARWRDLFGPEAIANPRPGGVPAMPAVADVPPGGQRIARGQPLISVFARGTTRADCMSVLTDRARRVEAQFVPA